MTVYNSKEAILTLAVIPANTTGKTVIWSSNDTSVATVDSNGKVTSKARGNATITSTANEGARWL
ncbi:MAG: Ig-like domain-containing protein [Prevotella sp.]|nr:Ig-like domain-containing protein [Prevotella sp.]